MEKTIRIVLTDDHPMILSGLVNALKVVPSIQILGAFTSGYELLQSLEKCQPDIILLDIQMPQISGEELARRILTTYPGIKIIILSAMEEHFLIQEMLAMGCSGFLRKSNTHPDLLVSAIESVSYGNVFLDDELKGRLMAAVSKVQNKASKAAALLTKKEKEVLAHIVEGLSSKKIAGLLGISIRTVETHRFSLLQKMDVKNTAELVRKAIELHLLQKI